jgi:outer membrane receptor protein involved in Fe transport
MTPGFTFQASGQSGLQPPVMRGLTANIMGFSSSVALVVDGVPTLRGQGFDDNLLASSGWRCCGGPQSTLYGRNAEAGVVSVVTRQPGNDPYAVVSAELGSRDKRALRFDASHALVKDTLYLGVAGELFRQDGFVDNAFKGGKETTANAAMAAWRCAGRPASAPMPRCAMPNGSIATRARCGGRSARRAPRCAPAPTAGTTRPRAPCRSTSRTNWRPS